MYLARTGDLLSSRAITLWGGTGRIHGWRLYGKSGRLSMATAMMGRGVKARARKQAESGFSLLEVMISMVILTVGLVSLLGVFGLAMATTQTSQQNMIAKQLANEAYESIVTARNSSQLSWSQIQNTSSCRQRRDPTRRHLPELGRSQFTDLQSGSGRNLWDVRRHGRGRANP